jgi:outer membrane receptor protein involved in Fe transport
VFKNAASASFARASVAAVVGGAAMLLWSSAVFSAEEKDDDAKEEDLELTEVQVTGTRILQPNATSTNPITTITGEEMQRLGIVNVADALTQLVPQNISTYSPALTGDTTMDGQQGGGMERADRGTFFIGNTIANLRGMDPAFGSRTLTLVNGRRVVSTSNQADVVDLNIIPSNLVERMDVVTGGAAATYGSGAMAGVVNVVLNRRVQGIRLDMDYGVYEAGDGGNPHFSLSGGTSILGGRGHLTGNVEWRKQYAIRDCAAARDWCAESRFTFNNDGGGATALDAPMTPLVGFEGQPRRFQMANVRYSQFAPAGAIYVSDVSRTSGYRFDGVPDPVTGLLGGEEYAFGFRGGSTNAITGIANDAMNGDGPLATSGQTLRPSNESRSFLASFEYDITPTTVFTLEGTYATTDALNKQRYSQGIYCTRFDQGLAIPVRGTNVAAGQVLRFSTTTATAVLVSTGVTYGSGANTRDTRFGTAGPTAAFAKFLGLIPQSNTGMGTFSTSYTNGGGFESAADIAALATLPTTQSVGPKPLRRGVAYPFWVPVDLSPNPPNFNFNGNAVGTWVRIRYTDYTTNANLNSTFSNDFWLLDTLRITQNFDSGTATVLPEVGRNAYAFLNNLSPDALYQLQNAFGNRGSAGAPGGGAQALYGVNPCTNHTAVRKVWNPQLQQSTQSETERYTVNAGLRGRFGADWRWDVNFSHGSNESKSTQFNSATQLRSAFAMDAVVDDRLTKVVDGQVVSNLPENGGTYGTPICRIVRDGAPVVDLNARPLSATDELARLAAGCKPLNIFGSTYSNGAFFRDTNGNRFLDGSGNPITYDAAAIQQQALNYAFVQTQNNGTTSQQSLSLTTSGTLYQGWAGPLRGALTLDVNTNENDNKGTEGDVYLKADLGNNWVNAAGGKTRNIEPSIEMSLPLVSGQDGIDLLSISGTYRYGLYYVKGGAGTTGEDATQKTPSWRISAEFSPFDWVRFRATRSQDLRAAGYRELFRYTALQPDQFEIANPWRPRTATSNEGQIERYGQIQVGNPDLQPERSSTMTMGFVLSPGGWAQGMRVSIDYSDIRVKDGITLPFNANMPVQACFTQSGGLAPQFDVDGQVLNPGNQTAFDPSLASCQQLSFAEQKDANGDPIPGTRDLLDLISYTSATYQNGLPYQNRGIDVSVNYNFPLSRALESLPGSLSLTARATRTLEASGVSATTSLFGSPLNPDPCGRKYELADPQNYNIDAATGALVPRTANGVQTVVNRYNCLNLVGQIRSSTFVPGISAAPKWRGNLSASYLVGNFTTTLAAQYTGGSKVDLQWTDDPNDPRYYTSGAGQFPAGLLTNATVDNNTAKAYVNISLNAQYNLRVANMSQFQIFGSINNLMDKDPPFLSGGTGGAVGGFYDTYGRAYRFGVRLRF